jgi:hypothetical protein
MNVKASLCFICRPHWMQGQCLILSVRTFHTQDTDRVSLIMRCVDHSASKLVKKVLGPKAAPLAIYGPCIFMKLRSRFQSEFDPSATDNEDQGRAEPHLSPAASFRRRDWQKLCDTILRPDSYNSTVNLSGYLSPAANSLRSRKTGISSTALHSASHLPVNKIFPHIFVPSLWRGKSPKQLVSEWLAQMPSASRMAVKYRSLPLPPDAHNQMHRAACEWVDANEAVIDTFECLIAFPTKGEAEQNAALLAVRDMHEITRNLLLSKRADYQGVAQAEAFGTAAPHWRSELHAASRTARIGPCFSDISRSVDFFGDGSFVCMWIRHGDGRDEFPEVLARVSDLKGLFRPASDVPLDIEDTKAWAIEWQADTSGEVVRVLSNMVPPAMLTEHVALPSCMHMLASIMRKGDIVGVRVDSRYGWGVGGLVPLIPPRSHVDGIVMRAPPGESFKPDISKTAIASTFAKWAAQQSPKDGSGPVAVLHQHANVLKALANKSCGSGSLSMVRQVDGAANHGSLVRWRMAHNLYLLSQFLLKAALVYEEKKAILDEEVPLRLNRALCSIAQARLCEGSALELAHAKQATSQSIRALEYLSRQADARGKDQYLLWTARAHLRCAEAAMLSTDGGEPWNGVQEHLDSAESLLKSQESLKMDGLKAAGSLRLLVQLRQELASRVKQNSKSSSQFWQRAFLAQQTGADVAGQEAQL